MIKVEYEFYQSEYGGNKIPDVLAFRQPLLKANTYLNRVMRKTPEQAQMENVKLCLCEVSDLIYGDALVKAEHGGREVKSENTDGYSVTYETQQEGESLDVRVYSTIRRHLAHTGLLYLGVRKEHACKCYDYDF